MTEGHGVQTHRKAYVCSHVFERQRDVLLASRPEGDRCLLCGGEPSRRSLVVPGRRHGALDARRPVAPGGHESRRRRPRGDRDAAHAVHVDVEPALVVQGAVHSYLLHVRDAAGGATALSLGEGLVPPQRFWVQASELLERSGVEQPEVAAHEIAAVTGRSPANPTRA